jgi:hypothetical protein
MDGPYSMTAGVLTQPEHVSGILHAPAGPQTWLQERWYSGGPAIFETGRRCYPDKEGSSRWSIGGHEGDAWDRI